MSTAEGNKRATYIGLKFNKHTDADILEAIGEDRSARQDELRRLLRAGIAEAERRRGIRMKKVANGKV